MLNDRSLLGREREVGAVGALGGSRWRYGDDAFPPAEIVPHGAIVSLSRSGYIPYVRSAEASEWSAVTVPVGRLPPGMDADRHRSGTKCRRALRQLRRRGRCVNRARCGEP